MMKVWKAEDIPDEYLSAIFAQIDWSGCPYVAINPDFGGHPVVKGIERLPVEALVANHIDGESIEDLAFIFECPAEIVRTIIEYWNRRHVT